MNLDEIDILAKKGGKPSEDFTGADSCYFWTMKSIYALYALRKIDVQTAKAEKLKARQKHAEYTRDKQASFQAYKEWNEAIKQSDMYIADISKATDPEVKLGLCLKCIAAITGNRTILEVDK